MVYKWTSYFLISILMVSFLFVAGCLSTTENRKKQELKSGKIKTPVSPKTAKPKPKTVKTVPSSKIPPPKKKIPPLRPKTKKKKNTINDQSRKAVTVLKPPSYKTSPFLSEKSFINNWNVLGPFPFSSEEFKNKFDKALEKSFVPNENLLDGKQKPLSGTDWKKLSANQTKPSGKINLNSLYGNQTNMVAYAVANIYAPQKLRDLSLCIGNSDFLKIWINGKLVHTYTKPPRKSDWDQDIINNISLEKGYNTVVVKCLKTSKDWNFFFRLTNKDGMPLCSAE